MSNSLTKSSLRFRLILLFIAASALPLLLLGWTAWYQSKEITDNLTGQVKHLVQTARQAGDEAIADSVHSLDDFAQEEIEKQTKYIANAIANFLYDRDADILYAGTLTPSASSYRQFIENKRKKLIYHDQWKLTHNGQEWEPVYQKQKSRPPENMKDKNIKDFHYHSPSINKSKTAPLYLEMTFVGLDGKEQVKITTSENTSSELKDISVRKNTYAKAENYFNELKKLKPGDIYVSDVIGSYVGSQIIGPYTPDAAAKKGIPFAPQKSAYAGKENPAGKRFKGIIRWATPVTKDGKITGWVTLALNHDHLMQFTDVIDLPTEQYEKNHIADKKQIVIWDQKGRSIVHPRHHAIAGYDPETGDPVIPWMEEKTYEKLKQSGLPYAEFAKSAVPETTDSQNQQHQAAKELAAKGSLALDCRWMDFSHQCSGWKNLTDQGGAGSYQVLQNDNWKLTANAAIPYYTGQYDPKTAKNQRGFGVVTIGTFLNEFHAAAKESQNIFSAAINKAKQTVITQGNIVEGSIKNDTHKIMFRLSIMMAIMIGIVIFLAIWISSYLFKYIQWINTGCQRFREGEYDFRFDIKEKNEITDVAVTFNEMADNLNKNIGLLKEEIQTRKEQEAELQKIKDNLKITVDERTKELSEANIRLQNEVETRQIAEDKALHLAGHDALTGIANRQLLHQSLKAALAHAKLTGKMGALLRLNIDHFKRINDEWGYAIGDSLLVQLAGILKRQIGPNDVVARLGGDEFAIIQTDLTSDNDAAILAEKILDQLKDAITVDKHHIHIFTSIGITIFTESNDQIEQVLMQSDIAMRQAKEKGSTDFCFFEESMQYEAQLRKQLESELRTAIKERQFIPYFQPIFDTLTQRVVSMEVLVRWEHPEQGITSPREFIDVATMSGLMPDIDKNIIELACLQAKAWENDNVEFGKISVNILPEKISSPDFVNEIAAILEKTNLPANKLAVEITERALLEDRDQVLDNLYRLREMGATIYIDDFGVEYSSLQRLIEYPIDVLKIDRFFVRRIGNRKTEIIIEAIANIARSIGMKIVVEGVESQAQLDYLSKHDCHVIQGYLHARPLSSDDATQHLLKYSHNLAILG